MRLIFEVLWSLNASAVVVWEGDESGSSLLLGVLYRFCFPVLHHFKPDFRFRHDYSLAFWAMILLLAIVIFLLLRLLTSFSLIRRFLLPILGVVSVSILPVGFWLVLWIPHHSVWGEALLFVETIAAIVCAVLYTLQTRQPPRFLGGILLLLHFLIWGFACNFLAGLADVLRLAGPAETFFWWVPLRLYLPIFGFISCATWAMYTRAALRAEPSSSDKPDNTRAAGS